MAFVRTPRTARPARRASNDNAPRKSRAASAANGATPGREIDVVITPADFDHRTDRLGRPYAWVRGVLTYRKVDQIRTVMISGETYLTARDLLSVGTSIKIRGRRTNVVETSGRVGGEFFSATEVLKVYDAEGREIDGSSGRVLEGHVRSGHYRRQHYGPGNSLVKIVWIDDAKVNGGAKAA